MDLNPSLRKKVSAPMASLALILLAGILSPTGLPGQTAQPRLRPFQKVANPPAALVRKYVKDNGMEDWLRDQYANDLAAAAADFQAYALDLNADGSPEYLLVSPQTGGMCGSGGCSGAIYVRRGEEYQEIQGENSGGALLFGGAEVGLGARPTSTNGFSDLEQVKRSTRYVLKFDGRRYRYALCSEYDFRRKVWSETACADEPAPKTGAAQDAAAPTACKLDLSSSPVEVRGLRLGMTAEEAGQKLGLKSMPLADESGLTQVTVDSSPGGVSIRSIPSLEGVGELRMMFLDGSLRAFNLTYEPDVEWDGVEEYIGRLSETLRTPGARFWTYTAPDDALVSCRGLTIRARFADGQGRRAPQLFVQVTDLKGEVERRAEEVRRRAEAEKERRKRAFKP